MGYAYYEREGMERGYSVPDVCHAEDCAAWKPDGEDVIEFDCFAGQSSQCCKSCAQMAEREAEKESRETVDA